MLLNSPLLVGVERCRKLILLSISRNFGKKLRYYQQQLLQFQQPKIELQSCTLSFLQSCFCSFCRYNFGNFFSDAESADISALDADDFSDVTLVCEDSQRFEAHKVILAASFETLLVSALLLLLSPFFLQICCWKLLKYQLTYLH